MKPRICILTTDGTNCNVETAHAVDLANGEPVTVHINRLRRGDVKLADFQGLIIPGGFSYGDDVASGKILATELMSFLGDQVREFVTRRKPILGICNGFQVLVRMGLLPYPATGNMHATLAHNDSGHFQCQWVDLVRSHVTPCVFTPGMPESFPLQMAHGEGRFVTDPTTLVSMKSDGLIVLRYKKNPNGSQDAIAGICDPTGTVFGLMPHPERLVHVTQHPNWRRQHVEPVGLSFFLNGVAYAAQL